MRVDRTQIIFSLLTRTIFYPLEKKMEKKLNSFFHMLNYTILFRMCGLLGNINFKLRNSQVATYLWHFEVRKIKVWKILLAHFNRADTLPIELSMLNRVRRTRRDYKKHDTTIILQMILTLVLFVCIVQSAIYCTCSRSCPCVTSRDRAMWKNSYKSSTTCTRQDRGSANRILEPPTTACSSSTGGGAFRQLLPCSDSGAGARTGLIS